ncbi:glycosyltransferase family 2 protein [uncultured Acetobacteroides sp.]|uniref:glycosyltransferase family 2 protein n=1 Tax=uncultured Acetobacteroides sp. TaxID=1760811 RepID=UPI0029F4888A|nr:glycosyltransferase family 2 protein [uncultured Acetobacteroides sp.]
MLSIIIVNYKNELRSIEYIKNELSKVSMPHIVVVINNAAMDDSNRILSEALNADLISDIEQPINKDKRCFVVAHPDNLGFAKGNNLGVEFSVKHFDVDYFLFSNNDISFVNSDVVEQLVAKISNLSNVGLIGPKVIGLDGKDQSPEPYMPFWKKYIWMYWLTPFLSKKIKTKLFKLDYSEKAKEGIHYKIMGSFFLAKKNDFIKCGMMDPNTFLYAEELILSERLSNIGKFAYYYPEVTIIHEHGKTTSQHYNTIQTSLKKYESENYYYRKYKNISLLSIFLAGISLKFYLKLKGLQK